MTTITKSKTIEGIVEKVKRSYHSLDLTIYDGEKLHTILPPVRVKTDLELIPYQIALQGQQLTFNETKKEFETSDGYVNRYYDCNLKLLSGPLKNNEYHWRT